MSLRAHTALSLGLDLSSGLAQLLVASYWLLANEEGPNMCKLRKKSGLIFPLKELVQRHIDL